jgi:6-phosphogluconolactonase
MAKGELRVYIGTYTGEGKGQGIYVAEFDPASGKMGAPELAAKSEQPSFLAIHPNGRFVYAVSEVESLAGKKTGAVSAFAIDAKTGKLVFLNRVASGGPGPCYLVVDHTGKNVLVANYSAGSAAVLALQANGRLREASSVVQHTGSSVNKERQEAPHAHSINLSPDNRFAFVADLGLDKVMIYRFDAVKGTLTPNQPAFVTVPPGSGPRHFAFHPTGRFAYVISEMGNTVTAFSYDAARGALNTLQTITTLPQGYTQTSYCAEVLMHPSGKFLYGSNRGHDSIAVFAVDPVKGTLTTVEQVPTQGKTPRNFRIDPAGNYLLAENSESDSIVVFRIDSKTGRLTPTGQVVKVSSPVCVRFVAVK